MKITQATMTPPAPEDRAFLSSVIKPMLVRPRFLEESDLLLHVPFLFWLMANVRPAKSTVVGIGKGVAYLAICQAIEEFSIQGRCSGFGFGDNSENTPNPVPKTFDNDAETLYEGIADLRDHATLEEALSNIQPGSLDLLFVDLCELARDKGSDPADWTEKLAPGGCLVAHGLGEADEAMLFLKRKVEDFPGHSLLFFDFGAGLAVILKNDIITDAARDFLALGGNGSPRRADSLLLRRLGQGLAAMARNGNIARRLDAVQKEYAAVQTRHDKAEQDLVALNDAYEARNRKIWELQATNFDRENENRNLQKHQQVLSDSVSALRSALETIQKEKDSVAEVLTERLRQEKDSHYRETGILTKLLEQKGDGGQGELAMLRRQVKQLSDHNAALLSSTSWRITAPIRKIKSKLTGK